MSSSLTLDVEAGRGAAGSAECVPHAALNCGVPGDVEDADGG